MTLNLFTELRKCLFREKTLIPPRTSVCSRSEWEEREADSAPAEWVRGAHSGPPLCLMVCDGPCVPGGQSTSFRPSIRKADSWPGQGLSLLLTRRKQCSMGAGRGEGCYQHGSTRHCTALVMMTFLTPPLIFWVGDCNTVTFGFLSGFSYCVVCAVVTRPF